MLPLQVVHGLDVLFHPPDLVIRCVVKELWLVKLMSHAHRDCELQLVVCQALRTLLHLGRVGIETNCFYVVTRILLQAYDVEALGLSHHLDFVSQCTVASLWVPRVVDDVQSLGCLGELGLGLVEMSLAALMASARWVLGRPILDRKVAGPPPRSLNILGLLSLFQLYNPTTRVLIFQSLTRGHAR